MKVSISLPDDDVAFLDRFADREGYPSRSSVVHRAVRLLKSTELSGAYESAWSDWASDGESELWDAVVTDGLGTDDAEG